MGLGQSNMTAHLVCGCFDCDRNPNQPFVPEEKVWADVWYGVGQPGFIFPELRSDTDAALTLKSKDDLAICLSGGGLRACVASLGYVRALHALGVLRRARYLNANSGSAWFSTPLCFQERVDTHTFLDEYVPPAELTLERAGELGPHSFAKSAADADHLIGILARKLASNNVLLEGCRREEDQTEYRAWEDAIGDSFFSAFDLNDASATFGLYGCTQNLIPLGTDIYAVETEELPFPVITSCGVFEDRLPEECPFVSWEFTPLYSGFPLTLRGTSDGESDLNLGGVLMESFACCSAPPEEPATPDSAGKAHVELEVKWVPPLAQAAGISSQFLAMIVNAHNPLLWDALGCPELETWNGIDNEGRRIEMTDGGGSDNLAIYPALRRGVKKLIVCSALAVPISDKWASDEFDISGYFGAYPDGESFEYSKLPVGSKTWNKSAQVFERRKWDELFSTLRRLEAEGKPRVVRMRLQVLPNERQGVEGGYEVDSVWIFNGRPSQWYDELPAETQDHIDEKLEGFPLIGTFIVDYDPETVGLLSNVCAWQVMQAEGEIESLLRG